MGGSITAFDAVVLGVLLLSGLMALMRGFVREALSITAFVAAALAALWMLPVLRELARDVIQPAWAADVATVVGVFLLVYLAVTLVTSSLAKQLRGGDEPGMVDRSFGLAFGVVRGLVLLALFVIAYTAIAPEDRENRWLTEAQLYPLVSSTAAALQELAPETSRVAERAVPAPTTDRAPPVGATVQSSPAAAEPPAYGDIARRSLDQLISARAEEDQNGETE